jgi:hypothetical protein
VFEQEVKPEMSFDEKDFEFGEIMQGDKVEHTFKFTNTGKAPLVISNARASCGCTVPQWPKEAIAPGAEGEIHVVFNSRGKSGRQNKSIRITTNIGEEPVVIYLKGNVKVPAPSTSTPSGNFVFDPLIFYCYYFKFIHFQKIY